MSELITKYDPRSPISEVFRLLRTNIQYINKDEKSTAIMLTSTTPANGKTFVTANLAITLAQANKRVILVDSDIRKPRLHKVFELENELGLSDYLSNSTDGLYIRKTNVENLSIVTAGTMVNNPSELIGQEKFKKTIEALKEKYDYVIIDSSPILMVTDSILVSRVVDATILIAIYNKTRIDDLKSAIRRINHVGGNVAGIVLNRTKVILNQYNTKYFYGNTIEVNNKSLRMKIKRFFYNRKIKKANKDLEKKQIKEEKTKAIHKNQKMINKINQKNQELENQTKITNEIEKIKNENNPKHPKNKKEESINNLVAHPPIRAEVNNTHINKSNVEEINNTHINNVNLEGQNNKTSNEINDVKVEKPQVSNVKTNIDTNKVQMPNMQTINAQRANEQAKANAQIIEQKNNTHIEESSIKSNAIKNNENNFNEIKNNEIINKKITNNNNQNSNNPKTNNPKINNNPKVLNKYMANILKDINNA